MVAPGKPTQQALRSCPHSMDVASDFIFTTSNFEQNVYCQKSNKKSLEINSVPGL
jgi:hypothetical protein